MVATPERIGFVTNRYRSVVASDAAVKAAYGERARDSADNKSDPVVETLFDDPADAQVIANERLALLSPHRRRFRQDVAGIVEFSGALDFSQTTPAVQVIDTERSADHAAAVVGIGIRYGDNKTTFETWG